MAEAKFNYFVESHGFASEEVENYPDVLMDRQVEVMILIKMPLKKPMPLPVVAISLFSEDPNTTATRKRGGQLLLESIPNNDA